MNTNTRAAAAVAPVLVVATLAFAAVIAVAIFSVAALLRSLGCPGYLSFSIAFGLNVAAVKVVAWGLRYIFTRR